MNIKKILLALTLGAIGLSLAVFGTPYTGGVYQQLDKLNQPEAGDSGESWLSPFGVGGIYTPRAFGTSPASSQGGIKYVWGDGLSLSVATVNIGCGTGVVCSPDEISVDNSAIPFGSGTLNYVPLWTPDGNTLGNSYISQSTNTNVFTHANGTVQISNGQITGGTTSGSLFIAAGVASNGNIVLSPTTAGGGLYLNYGGTQYNGGIHIYDGSDSQEVATISAFGSMSLLGSSAANETSLTLENANLNGRTYKIVSSSDGASLYPMTFSIYDAGLGTVIGADAGGIVYVPNRLWAYSGLSGTQIVDGFYVGNAVNSTTAEDVGFSVGMNRQDGIVTWDTKVGATGYLLGRIGGGTDNGYTNAWLTVEPDVNPIGLGAANTHSTWIRGYGKIYKTDADAEAVLHFENDAMAWRIGVDGGLNDAFKITENGVANWMTIDKTSGAFDINSDLSKFGSSDGNIFLIGSRLNAGYAINSEMALRFNEEGYAAGYSQFRNVEFYDGKAALACTVTGSTKSMNCIGGFQKDGTTIPDGTGTTNHVTMWQDTDTLTSTDMQWQPSGLIFPLATAVDNASPAITYVQNDDFLFDGRYLSHYGFGFYDGDTLTPRPYISGWFGIDVFAGGALLARLVNNNSELWGNLVVWGTDTGSVFNWNGDANQPTYIRAGRTAGTVYVGDNNTGGVVVGSASNHLYAVGKAAIGSTSTPQARLAVKSDDIATLFSAITAWDARWSAFGPNVDNANGAALGMGYDATNDTSVIVSVAPSIAWKPMAFNASQFNWWSGAEDIARLENTGALHLWDATGTGVILNQPDVGAGGISFNATKDHYYGLFFNDADGTTRWDIRRAAGDTTTYLYNGDPTYKAHLDVEGNLSTQGTLTATAGCTYFEGGAQRCNNSFDDTDTALYLQYYTAGAGVQIGDSGTDHGLDVRGSISTSYYATGAQQGGYRTDGILTMWRSDADGHLYIQNPYNVGGSGPYHMILRPSSDQGFVQLRGGGDASDGLTIDSAGEAYFSHTPTDGANVSDYFGWGSSYGLNLAGYVDNHGSNAMWHNAYSVYQASGGAITGQQPKWRTTHGNFGSRGIVMSFVGDAGVSSGGIGFYADSAAATLNNTFTPTLRMLIANDGDVGIGTTNPLTPLQVGTDNNGEPIALGSLTPRALIMGSVNNTDTVSLLRLVRPTNSGNLYPAAVDFKMSSYSPIVCPPCVPFTRLTIGLKATGSYDTSDVVDVMSLTSAGRVGINTTTPGFNGATDDPYTGLQVISPPGSAGHGLLIGPVLVDNTDDVSAWRFTTAGADLYMDVKTYDGGKLHFRSGHDAQSGANDEWLTYEPAENELGINDTTPGNTLAVGGNVSTVYGGGFWVNEARTAGMSEGIASADQSLNFRAGNVDQRMVIDANGDVGINQGAGNPPTAKLQVNSYPTDPGSYLLDNWGGLAAGIQVPLYAGYMAEQSTDGSGVIQGQRPVLVLARQGRPGVAYANFAEFKLGRQQHPANTEARTRLDIALTGSVTEDAGHNIFSMVHGGYNGEIAARWYRSSLNISNAPMYAAGGLFQGRSGEYNGVFFQSNLVADTIQSGRIRRNVLLYTDTVGNGVANCGGVAAFGACNYGTTLTWSSPSNYTPRGVPESFGAVTADNDSGLADYRANAWAAEHGVADVRNMTWTFSVWMKMASGSATIAIQINRHNFSLDQTVQNCPLTTEWSRCSVTGTFSNTSAADNSWISVAITGFTATAGTVHMYGAQLENTSQALPYQENDATLDTVVPWYDDGENSQGVWARSLRVGNTMQNPYMRVTENGHVYLFNPTSNLIAYGNFGVAAPSFTSRSVGTKIVFYDNLGGSSVDYAMGIEGSTLWYSIPGANNTFQHRWYAGTTRLMDLRGDGALWINGGYGSTDQVLTINGSGIPVWADASGGVDPVSDDGLVYTTVSGDAQWGGAALFKGVNTNTSDSLLAGVTFQTGRDGSGNLFANQTTGDVAFSAGSGGFRHFIRTTHSSTSSSNSIDLYVNNNASAGGSTTPGTGNIQVARFHGNGSVLLGNGSGFITVNSGAGIRLSGHSVFMGDATGTSIGNNLDVLTLGNTGAGHTANNRLINASHTGTFNTTSGSLIATGLQSIVTATRSAGSNPLVNRAIYAQAGGGQENYAFYGNGGTLYNLGSALFAADLTADRITPPTKLFDHTRGVEFFDDLLHAPSVNKTSHNYGTYLANGIVNESWADYNNHPGVVYMQTENSGCLGNCQFTSYFVKGGLSGNGSGWFAGGGETKVALLAGFPIAAPSSTSHGALVGLFDNPGDSTPANGIYCRADKTSSNNWQMCTAKANTQSCADTSPVVAIAQDNWVRCEFTVNAGGTSVDFTITDVTAATTGTGSRTTNIPNTSSNNVGLGASMWTINSSTGGGYFMVDYLWMDQTLTTAR